MPADRPPRRGLRRGFVIGELLVAFLLLAVAVSSLAALMYSVSRHPATRDEVECVGKSAAASGKCAAQSAAGGPSKLLRTGCATQTGYFSRGCKDTVVSADSSGETIVRPRTDSASMAMLAKKEKPSRRVERPDRGFIR
jgi:Tfp pilus assembly protein PilV